MPDTRDVRTLEPVATSRSLAESILQSLGKNSDRVEAEHAFVVQGKADAALRQVYEILVSRNPPTRQPTVHEETWLVFFAHESGQYVHLTKVERTDNRIQVSYKFVPHDSKQTTRHFAIIPLGKLRAGEYKATIVNAPFDEKYSKVGYSPIPISEVEHIVCKSCEFEVINDSDK
jgi:hypothetical protein